MSKRGNHGGKAEHRERKNELKTGVKDYDAPIDLESRRHLRDLRNDTNEIIDMINKDAATGRETNVL